MKFWFEEINFENAHQISGTVPANTVFKSKTLKSAHKKFKSSLREVGIYTSNKLYTFKLVVVVAAAAATSYAVRFHLID